MVPVSVVARAAAESRAALASRRGPPERDVMGVDEVRRWSGDQALEGHDFRILDWPSTFVSRWVSAAERRQSQPTTLTAVTPITPRRNHRDLPDRGWSGL